MIDVGRPNPLWPVPFRIKAKAFKGKHAEKLAFKQFQLSYMDSASLPTRHLVMDNDTHWNNSFSWQVPFGHGVLSHQRMLTKILPQWWVLDTMTCFMLRRLLKELWLLKYRQHSITSHFSTGSEMPRVPVIAKAGASKLVGRREDFTFERCSHKRFLLEHVGLKQSFCS